MDDNLQQQANFISGQTQRNLGRALMAGLFQAIKLLGQGIGAMFHMFTGQ